MANFTHRLVVPAVFFICLLAMLWRGSPLLAQPTPPPYDPTTVPTPAQPPLAAPGAALFAQNCAPCHGATGNSDGETTASLPVAPPKFSDRATIWQRSPAEYFHTTKFGRIQNLMPPWRNQLDDNQIWQVVYYAWSLHTSQEQVQQGAALYDQSCTQCHGPTGAGDGAEASATLPRFDDAGAMSLRTQAELDGGWQLAHPELGQEWSAAERASVLDYIRTFSYVPPWQSPYRPGSGVIEGAVVQGTPDGGSVANLPITLTAFINFEPVQEFTTSSDATGKFAFDGLSTDTGVVYLASTQYAGVPYNSNIAHASPLSTTIAITLPVYETSEDASSLHIDRANWLVDIEPGALRVGIILGLSNLSDRAFSGQTVAGLDHPATVALAVPTGATEIQFEDGVLGGRYQQVGQTIYDMAPVPPGTGVRQLIYSYRLPFEGDASAFSQSFLYPVGALNLLIPDLPNLEVTVADLAPTDPQTIQGIAFRRWAATGLSMPSIDLELSNLPPAGAVDPRALGATDASGATTLPASASVAAIEPLVVGVLGALLLLALAGVLYVPLQRQQATDRRQVLAAEQEALIEQIAELDDDHEAGALPTAVWTRERAQLKRSLLAVAQELNTQ